MKILFRESLSDQNELSAAKQYFNVVSERTLCKHEVVIGRYSCLPYYLELQKDLNNLGCYLINSYAAHSYIADFRWYNSVKEYTFKTWNDFNFYTAPEGRYIVKGRTNSCKMRWNSHMFANSKREASCIAAELMADPLIGPQGIIYREYEPLETFEVGLNGLPMTNEFRFFFLDDKLVDFGYYWGIAEKDRSCTQDFIDFAQLIAKEMSKYCTFFVLDIAKTITGELRLVEVNDGQMSGLGWIPPERFYKNLYDKLVSHFGRNLCDI